MRSLYLSLKQINFRCCTPSSTALFGSISASLRAYEYIYSLTSSPLQAIQQEKEELFVALLYRFKISLQELFWRYNLNLGLPQVCTNISRRTARIYSVHDEELRVLRTYYTTARTNEFAKLRSGILGSSDRELPESRDTCISNPTTKHCDQLS